MVEAFPRVLCPVTERVPLEVSDEVAVTVPPVILLPVREEIAPVTAERILVKKLVEVALVKTGVSVKEYVTRPLDVVAIV